MKKAFTLLELVFVVIVIGILAASIIPRVGSNKLQEAAIQLVSHIRYTQHLAMIDDTFNKDDINWYKKRWQIAFHNGNNTNNKWSYSIFSDSSGSSTGAADTVEIAINPLNRAQRMTGGHSGDIDLNINSSSFIGMKTLNLKLTYAIVDIKLSKSCKVYGSRRIYFDYLGRPIKGKLGKSRNGGNRQSYEKKNLITKNCIITLISDTSEISLKITPETGYSCILNKENKECI